MWISGIGGYFPQCYDWFVRNPIYRDLINYDWPVLYSETGYALCYYLGYWLPPAFITKIFGLFGCSEWQLQCIGNAVLCLYTYICMSCVFLLICLKIYRYKVVGRKEMALILVVFSSFGGLAILGEKVAEVAGIGLGLDGLGIEHWSSAILVMNSNITMLMNVFNQLIPAWLAVMLFINLVDMYNLFGLIGFSVCISAPFPMVGLGILMLGAIVKRVCLERKLYIRQLCSVPNLCSIVMIVVAGLYFAGNNTNSIVLVNIFASTDRVNPIVWLLIVILFTFGGWVAVIFWEKRDYSVIFVALSLLLMCFITVNGGIDFPMRATIPGCFLIMLWVMECLSSGTVRKTVAGTCLPVMLTISFMTVWINFCNLCGLAVESGTFKRPYEAGYYSFEGNADSYDFGYINQYIQKKPNKDFFFHTLCGINVNPENPVVEKVIDDEGEMKIESVNMKLPQEDQFMSLIPDTEKEYALNQIELQMEGESGKVIFDRPLSIREHVVLENGDIDVEWLNYCHTMDTCNTTNLAHVLITNNSDKVIPYTKRSDQKLGLCVLAILTDKTGNKTQIACSEINRFLFPGESVSLAIDLPQNAGVEGETYTLNFSIMQRTENGDNDFDETYYTTSVKRNYSVTYK